jgi:hypothetical protein
MTRSLRTPKTCWHPLSLQQLAPSKFVGVVNSILSGRYSLLPGALRGMGSATKELGDLRSDTSQ